MVFVFDIEKSIGLVSVLCDSRIKNRTVTLTEPHNNYANTLIPRKLNFKHTYTHIDMYVPIMMSSQRIHMLLTG